MQVKLLQTMYITILVGRLDTSDILLGIVDETWLYGNSSKVHQMVTFTFNTVHGPNNQIIDHDDSS